jgi:exonuclease III
MELRNAEAETPVIIMGDLNETHSELMDYLLFENTFTLYSPWEENKYGGSYFYKGGWETIDHFLLSEALFDGRGWDYANFQVLDQSPFTTSSGAPNAYIPRNGSGLSDHLPLLLTLNFIQN